MEATASAPFERESPRPRAGRRAVRAGSIALMVLVAGVWFLFLRPSSLGGPATYVIVSGTSMLPTLESGDLVVAFEQQSYAVGDVIVYRVPSAEPGAGTKIVHRVVGGSAATGFVVRGDSREDADFWRPRTDEIDGKMRLRIPRLGSALVFLQQPIGIALVAALVTFVAALGASAGSSRK